MERLVLTWVGKPLAFDLNPGLNTVGRNPQNDVRISDASISSFHCELTVEGNLLKVRDLASTNGTYINGLKIDEGELKLGKTMKLGNVELQLEQVTVAEPAKMLEPALAGAVDNSTGFFMKLTRTLKIPFQR